MSVRTRLNSMTTNRYGAVIVLILLTYAVCAANLGPGWYTVVLFIQVLTVWLVFGASDAARFQRIAGIVLVVAGVTAASALLIAQPETRNETAFQIASGVSVLLYLVAPVVVLRYLLRRDRIDEVTLLGAIVVYLLLGMLFAFVFQWLGSVQPGPFFGSAGDGRLSDDLFFSFYTLTTVGYGNLVPAGNPGQTLAVFEAVLGQLFLVTAVAKIVSGLGPMRRRPEPAPDASGE